MLALARSRSSPRRVALPRTGNRIVLMPFKLIELENESMWRYGTIKEGDRGGWGGGVKAWWRDRRGRRKWKLGWGVDGYAKGGAWMCNNNPRPANSAAARHSDRSTGSNATTAYYASPSLRPNVFSLSRSPSFPPAIAISVSLFVSLLSPHLSFVPSSHLCLTMLHPLYLVSLA